MKYDVLFNFISPVTGRLIIPEDYILVGDGRGFSMPSPILIDMRLDLVNLRRDVNDIFDTSFIIGFPDIDFPNAQVLSKLEDGFMYNTAGIVSTLQVIPITALPDLTYNKIWVGDSSNRPIEGNLPEQALPDLSYTYLWTGNPSNRPVQVQKIIDVNLPDLSYSYLWSGSPTNRPIQVQRIIQNNLPDLIHKCLWSGDITDRPEQILEIDIDNLPLITYKNLWSGNVFNKVVEIEQIDITNLPDLTYKTLWSGNSLNKAEEIIQIDMINLPDLEYTYIWIGNEYNNAEAVQTIDIVNLPNLAIKRVWTGGVGNRPIEVTALDIDNMASLATNQLWIGDATNRPVATTKINTSNLPDLAYGAIWLGDLTNRPDVTRLGYKQLFIGDNANNIDVTVELYIDNLPNLTSGKFWQGDLTNRPVEVDINYAPDDATYIIRTANANLPNAHVTSLVGTGITKLVANGFFQIATPDTDYTTPEKLQQEVEQLQTQIDNLATRVTDVEGRVTSLETRMTAAEGEITTIQGEISTIQGEISTLQGEIIAIQGQVAALEFAVFDPALGLITVTAGLVAAVASLGILVGELNLQINTPVIGIGARLTDAEIRINELKAVRYIIQIPDSTVPNAQPLSLLGTGILKNQTGTGILSIAVSDSDYTSWGTFQTLQTDFNTFAIQTLSLFAALSLDVLPVRGNVSMYDTLNNTRRGIYALADGINPHDAVNKGQLDAVAAGALGGTVTQINTGTGLTGGPIIGSGTVSIANTTVGAGSYNWGNFTVNAQGQLIAASSNTSLPINFISGYPNDGTQFLRGDGIWSKLDITVNNPTGESITINNINAASFANDFLVKYNGNIKAAFGYNSSSDEAYCTAYGSAVLKFFSKGGERARFNASNNFILQNGSLIDCNNGRILNVGSGTFSTDGVNKGQLDSAIAAAGTVTSVNISTTSSGITVGGGPITTSGTLTVDINPQLQVLSQFSGLGFMARQGSPSFVARTLTGTLGEINVTNGNGTLSDPVFSLANTGVGAGVYSYPSSLTVDSKGRLSSITSGSNTITLTGDISGNGVLGTPFSTTLANSIQRSSGMEWLFTGNNSFTSTVLTTNNTSASFVSLWFLQKATIPWTGYIQRYTRIPNNSFSLTKWNSGVETSILSTSDIDDYVTIYQGLHMNNAPIDNVSTFAIGRTKGTVGASRIENYGTFASVNGPHYQAVTTEDNYPNFQNLCWSHDNISFNFDAYYDGLAFKSAHSGSNFQIYKIGNKLNFNYASAIAQGANIGWLTGFTLTSSGKFGIGTSSPNGDLQFPSVNNNRKIVLWEGVNNDHQYQGFGTNASVLRVQLPDVNNDLVIYAATSTTTSNEVGRIKGNGDLIIPGNIYGKSPYGSMYFESNATTTSPASGIWTKILGTTTSGLLNQFTMPTSNRLQYTGAQSIVARVYADL